MDHLPAVNAALNGLAGVLLVAGYIAIRNRRVLLHQTLMVAAFCTSVLFLVCYLYYHIAVKGGQPTYFTTPGWPKALYYAILWPHILLAAIVALVLAPVTLYLGFGATAGNQHRRIARWTLPIWLYVSVTGVVVYVMLYHLYPPAGAVGTLSG
jgi:uncharacterized membrane protein YozB (DUF420 family)